MSVYFVTCRDANAVKIGSSLDPHVRLKEIQWGCPLPLVLEAVVPGTATDEFAFHERFADSRIRGEWFAITDMIEAIIAAHPPPPEPEKVKGAGRPSLRETENSKRRRARFEANLEAQRMETHARYIRKLEKRSDITFPFRVKEDA